MINQIAHVQNQTAALPTINKDLLKARHIQTHVKSLTGALPTQVELWSPLTSGPYLVPVTRWIE